MSDGDRESLISALYTSQRSPGCSERRVGGFVRRTYTEALSGVRGQADKDSAQSQGKNRPQEVAVLW